MTTGLILLGFLAVLVAFFLTRMRRRLGLATTSRTWAVIIAVFVVVVLGLWTSSQR
jgi:hypothetical protein